ncbi:hypothetical protein DPMN_117856 [Dreissena polymorpha]|uniref:Uncharacterized protein n=1 Tax=Dreissena polymorpha TaxID=45954 RepID=A0A9D4GJ00_DREPO|nr:hypothetical protein DPMN_117856 [Dreissena polymorpha]
MSNCQDIIKKNILVKYHHYWTKTLVSSVLTSVYKPNVDGRTDDGQRPILKPHLSNQAKNVTSRENCPTPPGSHFHDDWAKNVTSRVFTSFFLQFKYKENAPPPHGSHETNVLTKFHENWATNVTSRVFTCFRYIHIEKIALPTGGHVFSPIWTIFDLVRDINKTNFFTKKTAPSPGSHVFQRTATIFELNSPFTCFHYIHIEKTSPPPEINKTNVLTKFHGDLAEIMTSRVFTRKTSPPTGGHTNILTTLHEDWASTVLTSFQLNQGIIGTNLLTKFHDDRTRNVASRVFTSKTAPPTGGHVFQ